MIKVENGIVKIPDPQAPNYYEFRLDRAGDKYAKTNYSDWIIHIGGKTWATMPLLEELAGILKKVAPQIDWDGSLLCVKSWFDSEGNKNAPQFNW